MWRTTGGRLLVLVFLCLCLLMGAGCGGGFTASAQRTMSGQGSLTVSGAFTGTSVGAGAFYAQYTLGGFWETGLTGCDYVGRVSTGHRLRYDDVAVAGGYLFRLAATRSRSLNVYAGGGAFMGVELVDPMNGLPAYLDLGVKKVGVLYGVYASAQSEIFVGRRLALVVGGRLPVNFSSRIAHFHWQVGLGLRFLFY